MKHINIEKNTFVRNMLIVDPRTGNGEYALVKCSIEDAIACEMITQKEVDAARQAKQDQGKEAKAMVDKVKYVKLIDSPGVLEVHGIDFNFEGQTAYMLEAEKGLIEPYSERLVERKFYSYTEVAHYLYGQEQALEIATGPKMPQPDPIEKAEYDRWMNEVMEGL